MFSIGLRIVSWSWTLNFNVLFPEPLSYHFGLMVFHHSGKGIVIHQTVLGWLEEVAVAGCFGSILYWVNAIGQEC